MSRHPATDGPAGRADRRRTTAGEHPPSGGHRSLSNGTEKADHEHDEHGGYEEQGPPSMIDEKDGRVSDDASGKNLPHVRSPIRVAGRSRPILWLPKAVRLARPSIIRIVGRGASADWNETLEDTTDCRGGWRRAGAVIHRSRADRSFARRNRTRPGERNSRHRSVQVQQEVGRSAQFQLPPRRSTTARTPGQAILKRPALRIRRSRTMAPLPQATLPVPQVPERTQARRSEPASAATAKSIFGRHAPAVPTSATPCGESDSEGASRRKNTVVSSARQPKEKQMSTPPDSEPEPTRPTWKMLLVVAAAILVAEAAYHWSDISAFAHLPEIANSLGIG